MPGQEIVVKCCSFCQRIKTEVRCNVNVSPEREADRQRNVNVSRHEQFLNVMYSVVFARLYTVFYTPQP